jgi:2-aminoadipate transaminase
MLVKSPALPLATATRRIRSSAIRDLLAVTERPEIISLAGGLPAPDAFPTEALAKVTANVLATDARDALQYSATAGWAPLRTWVADGCGADPDQVVVTHGSQQALELTLRALVDPGDLVAVPDPAYVGALQAIRLSGAELLPVPVDVHGIDVEHLADRLAAGARPRVLYVVADLDNPTGTTLPEERLRALATLADRYGFVIVDDEPYGALRWNGDRPAALHTFSDRVVSLGTTSKTLCPGLRIGWAIAPQPVADALILLKQAVDLQTATFTQRIAHGLLSRPEFLGPHLAGLRTTYRGRATALVDALRLEVDGLELAMPDGGMFLWARLPGVDTSTLLDVAVTHGTAFVPGAAFAVTRPATDRLRLSFATASEPELTEAARRLGQAVKKVTHQDR